MLGFKVQHAALQSSVIARHKSLPHASALGNRNVVLPGEALSPPCLEEFLRGDYQNQSPWLEGVGLYKGFSWKPCVRTFNLPFPPAPS